MYIYSGTLHELEGFLNGYLYSRRASSILNQEEEDIFRNFNSWLKKERFAGLVESEIGWRKMLIINYSDEYTAFKQFFILWNEYLTARSIV